MKKILVIAPHADDEVLGCGGTIARHVEKGDQVFVIIGTNANEGAPELFSEDDITSIREEALAAHRILGITKTYFLNFPAPDLFNYPQYKISQELDKLNKEIRPDKVYLPHPGDIHNDHLVMFMSSLVALRPVSANVKEIYTYETQSETEWAPAYPSKVFFPTMFTVLNNIHMEKKRAAMACFKSQLRESPNPRSLKKITALAEYRGGIVNEEYAEAFYLIRKVEF